MKENTAKERKKIQSGAGENVRQDTKSGKTSGQERKNSKHDVKMLHAKTSNQMLKLLQLLKLLKLAQLLKFLKC